MMLPDNADKKLPEKLKPCPLCGSEATLWSYTTRESMASYYTVRCSNDKCSIRTREFPSYYFDPERLRREGPESKYSGAYFRSPWERDLCAHWNTRVATEDGNRD